jgi:surfactin synthase thioesterase subunit
MIASKFNLFIFPFAGGSKYSYQGHFTSPHASLQIQPIEFPGRGGRIKEALLSNINLIVDDVFEKIRDKLDIPYAFYGHSMGALAAYLLAKKIVDANLPQPHYLFVSGRGGPSAPSRKQPKYLLPTGEFKKELKNLGGIPDDILTDDMMMDFFEPILRADFQAVECFQYQHTTSFDIPILIMIGENEDITIEEAHAWQKETTAPIEIIAFKGGHFFIFDSAEEIMRHVYQKIKASLNGRTDFPA